MIALPNVELPEVYFVPDYWPLFTDVTKKRVFRYTSPPPGPPFRSEFWYEPSKQSMIEVDFDHEDKFMNTWYMQYRPGFGYAEWRDDYPNGKIITFTTPIGWGEFVQVAPNPSSVYVNYPTVNIFKTWPPTLALRGTQALVFESHHAEMTLRDGTVYKNVLQMLYQQFWGKKQAGARMWMAKGVGPVCIQWVAADDAGKIVTSDRYDAVVTEVPREPLVA